ncbi:uncharacterized protein LOC142751090 [Rhinoderma darwinii]|uniref:uncharacterized protein LOC142751090 n=1 Tax=Rhinoderma darwinii TaxID=43563 RepID=UPI003F6629FE
MATSPDEQQCSRIPTCNSSTGHPKSGRNLHGKLLSSTNSPSNTPAYTIGRQKLVVQEILPRCVFQDVPKRPLPSTASSDGEPDTTADNVQAPISPHDTMIYTSQNEEANNSTPLTLAPETTSFSKPSETEQACAQEVLNGSVHDRSDLEQSKTSFHEISSINGDMEDSDLSGRASNCSSLYRSCSTPFSQLLSSSSYLSVDMVYPSKSEATFKNSSGRVTKQGEHYNIVPSPGLHSRSYLGNPNLQQASSHSVRKNSQASDIASSFDEMWHDRFLHHWPVLPPISPQRG